MKVRQKAGRRRKRAAPRLCACGVAVDADEREHLVRACAFFRADHFRATEPGQVRAADFEAAAADISTVLDRRKQRPAARPPRRRQEAGK